MSVEVNREIRRAVDTGKVLFGKKESETGLSTGEAILLIATSNAPKLEKERLLAKAKIAQTPVLEFEGSALDLGQVCGKPFNISFMIVKEQGKSSVLKAIEGKKPEKKAKKI